MVKCVRVSLQLGCVENKWSNLLSDFLSALYTLPKLPFPTFCWILKSRSGIDDEEMDNNLARLSEWKYLFPTVWFFSRRFDFQYNHILPSIYQVQIIDRYADADGWRLNEAVVSSNGKRRGFSSVHSSRLFVDPPCMFSALSSSWVHLV
jgi:hypothetical protein